MKRSALTSALLLAAVPLWAAAEAHPYLDLEATGGWESNLDNAVDAGEANGSATVSVRATGGAYMPLADDLEVYAEPFVSATHYTSYSDLSSFGAGASVGARWWITEDLSARLSPRVVGRWYGDDERDALDLGVTASGRLRLSPDLRLGARYGYQHHDASTAVYDDDTHIVGAHLEWELHEGWVLAIGYALEIGSDTFYAPAATDAATAPRVAPLVGAQGSPTPDSGGGGGGGGGGSGNTPDDPGHGGGGGGSDGDGTGPDGGQGSGEQNGPRPDPTDPVTPSDTFEPGEIAFRVDTLTHAVQADLTIYRLDPFWLRLGYEARLTDTQGDGTAVDHVVHGGVGMAWTW